MDLNNWYVITGTTSAGKTTLIYLLEQRGFKVIHEAAREYIDKEIKKGFTKEEIRQDEMAFQEKVLKMKIRREKKLPKEKIIFFDRGIPDTEAYYKLRGFKNNKLLSRAMKACWYKKIFLLDYYDLKEDYARIETKEEQVKLQDLLYETYKKLKFPIVRVPAYRNSDRKLDFVLKRL